MCVVGSAHGGTGVRVWRSDVLERLIAVVDEGRLQGLGLLTNTAGQDAHTKGAANAWQLTELGERVTQQLALNTDLPQEHDA